MKLQAPELPSAKSLTPTKAYQIVILVTLTFVVTVISLNFSPYSHKKVLLASYDGYQNVENTVGTVPSLDPPPKPNNPPCCVEADTRRLNHSVGGGMAAENLAQKQSSGNPAPSLDTAASQADLTMVNNSISEENRRLQPARDSHDGNMAISEVPSKGKKCDLFTGEWVPNPEAPYYTNMTCDVIQEQQNCMKYGRPDREFLKWRWKPDGCKLPIFDPYTFFELVRGKSLTFVGDSVARNQMQSLICLLSRVAHPVNLTKPTDKNRLYHYPEYDFNISIFSSPYLIRAERTNPDDIRQPFKLFLDEFDETWTAKIEEFDFIIISGGPWFFRPTYFYLNRTLLGCLYCQESDINHLNLFYSYRWAFRTAFRAINGAKNFKGVTFLRTFSPSHFEGGAWDNGGDCVRTRPFKRNEIALEYYTLKMHRIQSKEMRIAQKAGSGTGRVFRLFDATKPMLLRPDGHPGKYGRWAVANQTFSNDCVHWCLPGPIDSWNDILQELLSREVKKNSKLFT